MQHPYNTVIFDEVWWFSVCNFTVRRKSLPVEGLVFNLLMMCFRRYCLDYIWQLDIFMYSYVCESTIIILYPGIAFIYYHSYFLIPNHQSSVLFILVFSESNTLATSRDNTMTTGRVEFKCKLSWKFINQIPTQIHCSQLFCFSLIPFCLHLLNLKKTVHMLICDYECQNFM